MCTYIPVRRYNKNSFENVFRKKAPGVIRTVYVPNTGAQKMGCMNGSDLKSLDRTCSHLRQLLLLRCLDHGSNVNDILQI